MLTEYEKSHRFRDDLFTWWSVINEFRANNLTDLKELSLEIKLLDI